MRDFFIVFLKKRKLYEYACTQSTPDSDF